MNMFVTYDLVTKEITGRYRVENPEYAKNYLNRIEVTEDEFNESPELTKKVDTTGKKLIPK